MNLRAATAFLCLALTGGCTVGPAFKAPNPVTPDAFRGADSGGTNSLGDLAWWQLFKDEALQHLINTALTNSYDLRLAAARVEAAQAVLAQNRSYYYPQVGYQGASGAGRNVVAGVPAVTGKGAGKASELAGTLSWEIDLWGRIRRLNEAARAQYFASREARRDVLISLISSVAQSYFQLLVLDEELRIAQDATNSFAQSLKLFNDRLQNGVASKLETSSAEALLATAEAAIPEVNRQIVAQENQISVLLGMNPGPIVRNRGTLHELSLPDIPPGLPSQLLERRPDVRQALELMRAANAQIGVATAGFYPTISLTGLFGEASPELLPFTAGTVGAWSAAASLTGPIFQGGLLRGRLHEAQANSEAARYQYQATVLNAFREVSDALVSRRELADEARDWTRAVASYQTAVQVANQRYVAGQASYYELLQSQQQLYPAQKALAETLVGQLASTIQLYKALGGGWNSPIP